MGQQQSARARWVACSQNGDLNTMRLMVEWKEVDVREALTLRAEDEKDALTWAAHRGDHHMVAFLLELGADKLSKDKYWYNCLHHACEMGHIMVVRLLVRHAKYGTLEDMDGDDNDDDEADYYYGNNAAAAAAAGGRSRGDGRDVAVSEAAAARSRAASAGHAISVFDAEKDLFELVNAKALHNITPLHCAVKYGHSAVVDYLLRNGADPKAPMAITKGLVTPLHLAGQLDDWAIVKMLLNVGADPCVEDLDGVPALSLEEARRRGEHDIARRIQREPHVQRRVTFLLGMRISRHSSARKQRAMENAHAPEQKQFHMQSFEEMAKNKGPIHRSFFANPTFDVRIVEEIFGFLGWEDVE